MTQMSRAAQSIQPIRVPHNDLQKTLLFVGPNGIIPQRNKEAAERNLPWVIIDHVENFNAIFTIITPSVLLILIDPSFLKLAETACWEIQRFHPHANVIVIDSGNPPVSAFPSILNSQRIRGILPTNLKLDVWVSVLDLLVRGGEYFPRISPDHREAGVERTHDGRRDSRPKKSDASKVMISHLTGRELQILQLIAKGLQNKIIASTLNLSEHTVKIHVHNIITKLGAHNRTGAASLYRDGQNSRESSS